MAAPKEEREERLDNSLMRSRRQQKREQLEDAGLLDNKGLQNYEAQYDEDTADYEWGGFLPRSNTKERF